VTDYFCDGDPTLRNTPAACCITGGKVYVRPYADDFYLLRAVLSISRLTALAGSDTIHDDILAQLVVLGAAILYLNEKGESERVEELMLTYEWHKTQVGRKRLKQNSGRQSQRTW
jgi:hypothetical protein